MILNLAKNRTEAEKIARAISEGEVSQDEREIWDFHANVNGELHTMKMIGTSDYNPEAKDKFKGDRGWKQGLEIELFEAEIIEDTDEDTQKKLMSLKSEMKQCKILIVWKFPDYYGYQKHIPQFCKEIVPGIECYRIDYEEATRDELTPINLGEHNWFNPFVEIKRGNFDLRVGAALTRMQTNIIRPLFEKYRNSIPKQNAKAIDKRINDKRPTQYGAVIFPILGLVVRHYQSNSGDLPVNNLIAQISFGDEEYRRKRLEELENNKEYITISKDKIVRPTPLGKALIKGYIDAGVTDLTQPTLRNAFETKLHKPNIQDDEVREICQQEVQTYKELYLKLKQNEEKLKKALAESFYEPWP